MEGALNSQYAPFDLVFDCVGGADLIPHLDKLLVNDQEDPKRGMYVTIVGDSEYQSLPRLLPDSDRCGRN